MKNNYFLTALFFLCVISFYAVGQLVPLATSSAGSILIEKVIPKKDTLVIPYEKWKLKNGLTLIISEDHSDPVANITIQYHVGSAKETPGRSGFAHFYEKILTQGSAHVANGEHKKLISTLGGYSSGFADEDQTKFYDNIPSNNVEFALWLESDRMGFLLDSLTEKKFEVQRTKSRNEKLRRIEKNPGFLADDEVKRGVLYPAYHPYALPVIGYSDDLDRATVDDLKNFFLRWYGPNNATVCIAGDVDPQSILSLVEKYFGNLAPSPEIKKIKSNVPVLSIDKYSNYVDNISSPYTIMAFPTVPSYHRDEAALNVLAELMGRGKQSIFYRNFVRNERSFGASVSHNSSELSGEFQVSIYSYPNPEVDQMKQFDQTERDIRSTFDDFEKEGITDEALGREKMLKVAEIIHGLSEFSDGIETVQNKSEKLVKWNLFAPKGYNLPNEINRYNKLTKEDIISVYNKYIKGKFAAFVNVFPRRPDDLDTTKSINPYAAVPVKDDPVLTGRFKFQMQLNFC